MTGEISAGIELAESLNRACRCIAVDPLALEHALESGSASQGFYRTILERQSHLFSSTPVFVARQQVRDIASVVSAVESAIATPGYRAEVLSWAPAIALLDSGVRGAFVSLDFHLGRSGPQLIEINTNAGGALLNAYLARAQQACCAEVEALVAAPGASGSAGSLEESFVEMFHREWRLVRDERPLESIAIVDDGPESQYLYPEFLLFRELFLCAGLEASIVDPGELHHEGGMLCSGPRRIDLVYNRLTDFQLVEERHRALREALLAGDVVLTPDPRAHALYADKRNLTVLSDPERLRALGVPVEATAILAERVPRTFLVEAADGERWWAERKRYFFKPVAGYAGKGAYRGDKLTRGTWREISELGPERGWGEHGYVAQQIVPPSERTIELDGRELPLKLDLRAYVYAGSVQLLAARLYQGQTTNFRTAGGGFSAVFTERATGDAA